MAKEYALEHLNDVEYDKRWDQLHYGLREAVEKILTQWVNEGVITESEKEMGLEDWANSDFSYSLFPRIMG